MTDNGRQTVVPPHPVPLNWAVQQVPVESGGSLIALSFQHPMGTSVMFFSPDAADRLGNSLQVEASRVRHGLVVAKDIDSQEVIDAAGRVAKEQDG